MKEVKVKWFGYMEPIDEDINTFLAKNSIYEEDIIDIKYSVCHDGETGSYPTALLIYRDRKMVIIENLTKNIQKIKRRVN